MVATCKLGEKGCWNDGKCRATSNCENKAVTNADRIRVMRDIELAKLFTQAVSDGCPPVMDWSCQKDEKGWDGCDECWCRWLKQPAEGGGRP